MSVVCSRSTCTVLCAAGAAWEVNAAPAAPSAASPMMMVAPTAAARREMCMMTCLRTPPAGHDWSVAVPTARLMLAGPARRGPGPGRRLRAAADRWRRGAPAPGRAHSAAPGRRWVRRTGDRVLAAALYVAGGDLLQLSVAQVEPLPTRRARTHEVTRCPPSDVPQTARPRETRGTAGGTGLVAARPLIRWACRCRSAVQVCAR